MKQCYKCKKLKFYFEFSGSVHSKDGHLGTCLICMREYTKYLRIGKGDTKRPFGTYWVKNSTKSIKSKIKTNAKRKERRKKDHLFRFSTNTRSLIYNSFKRCLNGKYKKRDNTEKILGCTMEYFFNHISSLFVTGMSFDNYGEWHIDHKIPLSSAKTEPEIIKLNHYTNLQPLWAKENIKKGSKTNN